MSWTLVQLILMLLPMKSIGVPFVKHIDFQRANL